MSVHVTVTVDSDKETAKAALEALGFVVVRVTQPRTATAVDRVPSLFERAHDKTDRPAGLDAGEAWAYRRGYAQGAMAYTRKHGSPGLPGSGHDALELHKAAWQHEWDRHPNAHKAGLKSLGDYRTRRAVA